MTPMLKNILFILLAFTLLCACCARKPKENQEAVPSLAAVKSTGKLMVAEMTVAKMGTIDDLKYSDAKGVNQKARAIFNKFKIGSRKGAYSYDTYLRAYVDLSELSESDLVIDTAGKRAILYLPKMETELAGRDATFREEHYRVSGLRSDIDASQRARLKEEMNAMLKKEIADNAEFEKMLLEKGKEKAISYFTAFFADFGYTADIIFK